MCNDRQSALFPGLLFVLGLLLTTQGIFAEESNANPADENLLSLFQFQESEEPWISVDDVVMGGVSSSRLRNDNGIGIFSGNLSLDNNGGFASVRSSDIESSLPGTQAIRLRVKGDGKRYQLRIYAEGGRSGISYRNAFDTTVDTWIEVTLPYEDFYAGYRGRTLPDHPPIDPARIDRLGLLIADKQEGPFQMEVDWIAAVPAS